MIVLSLQRLLVSFIYSFHNRPVDRIKHLDTTSLIILRSASTHLQPKPESCSTSVMATDTVQNMTEKMREDVRKFKRAVRMVVLLYNKVGDLKTRYLRAKRDNIKSFIDTLDIQLTIYKVVLEHFFTYVCLKKEATHALQAELLEAGVIIDIEDD